MRGRRGRALIATSACLIATTGFAACGGSEPQDADEPEGEFAVEVTSAKFPPKQRLAKQVDLVLEFENVGEESIPNLAVTIHTGDEPADGSFNTQAGQAGLADPNRPVWILENGYPKLGSPDVSGKELDAEPSAGAEVASTNTFAFGAIAPGDSLEAIWRVTPVQSGTYTVHYELAAGLHGKAKAVTSTGEPVEGEFVTTITDRPPRATVTESGQVKLEQ